MKHNISLSFSMEVLASFTGVSTAPAKEEDPGIMHDDTDAEKASQSVTVAEGKKTMQSFRACALETPPDNSTIHFCILLRA